MKYRSLFRKADRPGGPESASGGLVGDLEESSIKDETTSIASVNDNNGGINGHGGNLQPAKKMKVKKGLKKFFSPKGSRITGQNRQTTSSTASTAATANSDRTLAGPYFTNLEAPASADSSVVSASPQQKDGRDLSFIAGHRPPSRESSASTTSSLIRDKAHIPPPLLDPHKSDDAFPPSNSAVPQASPRYLNHDHLEKLNGTIVKERQKNGGNRTLDNCKPGSRLEGSLEGVRDPPRAPPVKQKSADRPQPKIEHFSKPYRGSSEQVNTRGGFRHLDKPSPKVQRSSSTPHPKTTWPSPISRDPPRSTISKPRRGPTKREKDVIFDDPSVVRSYNAIPLIDITKLSRGGVSMETQAVGCVQFGIPPETIKDSMNMGLSVPSVYIVPVERFCREMGPALGVNLAEFEFPAYFNFFVSGKKCTLIVDSDDAERNIRRVFSETLLGPAQFRRAENPIKYEEEDFAPDFPKNAIPDFQKELQHFRIMPNGKELVLETLLKFCHFVMPGESGAHENLGVPPPLEDGEELVLDAPRGRLGVDASTVSDTEAEAQQEKESNGRPPLKKRGSTGSTDFVGAGDNVENDSMSTKASTTDDLPELLSTESSKSPFTPGDIEDVKQGKTWTYSQAKWIGDVATVFPSNASEEQIQNRSTKRVEIFKMPGGTEYILHDIDENNIIVGKARFSGNVRVSDSMSVDGFMKKNDQKPGLQIDTVRPKNVLPPTFHPPSFGVTVLGNSHGFDKNGSVSGYVLWINGRGVMIDPPPYSSATLEREGIRPRTIVGIILTHCHADHDAGAFQKVLTGSPVVVITTPTIYKSFIRKYAALSALSPALLRHSHRHKPAIIGAPLRFQGATFRFTYTLHSIPCVGFRVEWRGRSMVFTGDHFNNPPAIDQLHEKGVMSRARADDLQRIPLQDTDLLLHEAGAPPIHTPLEVLMKLPAKVRDRLYVVHTSALPKGCTLKVAPTGTAGTIRLDKFDKARGSSTLSDKRNLGKRSSILEGSPFEDGDISRPMWSASEYDTYSDSSESTTDRSSQLMDSSFAHLTGTVPPRKSFLPMSSIRGSLEPPLVSLRPTSSTDAWFILNLLSAVPFLSSLSYASTMEVLETARVDAFCVNDIVVPASRRRDLLVVVWEGTCMERESYGTAGVKPLERESWRISTYQFKQGTHKPFTEKEARNKKKFGAVWHAGDWTGPRALQPEKALSGESSLSQTNDIVAMSSEGVKVITVEFSNLHAILKSGSELYRKYLARKAKRVYPNTIPSTVEDTTKRHMFNEAVQDLNVIELLECNSALRKLSAVQKRHLESLAEGPVYYNPSQRLWRAGAAVDKAFIVVAGTVSFVPRRRNAGSVGVPGSSRDLIIARASGSTPFANDDDDELSQEGSLPNVMTLGETMRLDAIKAIQELGPSVKQNDDDSDSGESSISSASEAIDKMDQLQMESVFHAQADDTHATQPSRGIKKRADSGRFFHVFRPHDSLSTDASHDDNSLLPENELGDRDYGLGIDGESLVEAVVEQMRVDGGENGRAMTKSQMRRRSSRDRFANKVLGRLYSRRAFTAGLVFSKGHFLGDVSKMVAGLLSNHSDNDVPNGDDCSAKYGFGEKTEGKAGDPASQNAPVGELVIHEQEGDQHIVHSSTLAAGREGCVVLVFPSSALIPFLDEYPGLLLSLLGTQVVV